MASFNVVLHLGRRPRFTAALIVTGACWAVLPPAAGPINGIVAFDLGALLFLVLSFAMFFRATPASMRRRARKEDVGKATMLILTVAAAVASMAAIAGLLHRIKDFPENERTLALLLGGGSIVCSWLVTHTLFALHYAHVFYGDSDGDWDTPDRVGGLAFPGREHPDYWDFLYFSMVLGMTAQTSDVNITSARMRRITLGHSVLSFFFNTVILALSVNMAASL